MSAAIRDLQRSAPSTVAVLHSLPKSVPTRLIDLGLLHYDASSAGSNERYRRGETPQTVHVWWARRPHRAMRALVYASLCKEPSEAAINDADLLTVEHVPSPIHLQAARRHISSTEEIPKILDMFGGGGTIAFEASMLGADVSSIDSNELSVFIQKSLLVHSQKGAKTRLPNMVRESGIRVLEQLRSETADIFPMRDEAFGYLWTYSMECASCGYRLSLAKRPWISSKRGKRLAFVIEPTETCDTVRIDDVAASYQFPTRWIGRTSKVRCPKCDHTHERISIKQCRDELVACISNREQSGKAFTTDVTACMPSMSILKKKQCATLSRLREQLPATPVPRWSGIVNPALYGIETHSDFLNMRQRVVLLSLIACLHDEYQRLCTEQTKQTAKTIISLLSGMIDQLVDWNCRLSMWISQNEQVGRAFSGPGVAMLWDYTETDPVLGGPANLSRKLERIVAGTKALAHLHGAVDVRKAYAQQLPFESKSFDAIVTDPPYYDNIYYNVLADFFFSWKRMLLRSVEPKLFTTDNTDPSRELVASTIRSGDSKTAHLDYCRELSLAVREAERVLKSDGVFSLVYSHSSLGGWDAIIKAYRSTKLVVTSVQPLNIERKARPRAMASETINTCMVLVSHRSTQPKKAGLAVDLYSGLRDRLIPFVDGLAAAGWHESDIGVAAFAQGVGLLCNVSCLEQDDSDVLRKTAELVQEFVPTFRLVERRSL